MKKLLLHIGYPKTATTTLQESVFKKLFKLEKINYLGRNSIKLNEFEGEDYVIKLRKSGLYDLIIPTSNNFSPTLLNVISDENFLMLKSINEIQYNSESDWKQMCKKVFNLFEDSQLEVLVTLRKQSDLIFSLFLQKYKFLYAEDPNIKYQDFIFCKESYDLKADFEIYNFEELDNFFRSYKLKVNYLFFEDLKYDKFTFSSNLAKILDVNQNDIFPYLNTYYRNKITESHNDEMHMVSVKQSNLVFLDHKLKYNYSPNNVIQKIANRIFFNSFNKSIPKSSGHINKQLNNYYRSSNQRFFQKHAELKAKANSYGYF
jgi:hypothetical protein